MTDSNNSPISSDHLIDALRDLTAALLQIRDAIVLVGVATSEATGSATRQLHQMAVSYELLALPAAGR